jgi:hypothetical protein
VNEGDEGKGGGWMDFIYLYEIELRNNITLIGIVTMNPTCTMNIS